MTGFNIACTLPPHNTTFVQSPDVRGTLDIVYSCLAVVILCTWSVLHLNVPVQTLPANRRQKLTRALCRLFTKLKWMALNVLAPEWPFGHAVNGIFSEQTLRAAFDHYKEEDNVQWTRSHTQLANMGGFVIGFDAAAQVCTRASDPMKQDKETTCITDECCHKYPRTRASPSLWSALRFVRAKIFASRCTKLHDTDTESASTQCRTLNADLTNISRLAEEHQFQSTAVLGRQSSSDMGSMDHVSDNGSCVATSPCYSPDVSQKTPECRLRRAQRLSDSPLIASCITLRVALLAGKGCPHDLHTSRLSGNTTWRPDTINTSVARKAITTLQMEHLGDASDIRKFLWSPVMWLTNLRVLCGNRWALDANQLLLVRELGIIDKLPSISEDEINDLNKSDMFVKALAVCQISWLCIQLISRLIRGMPTTQLEVVTLAFTVCSVLTYCLFHSRPKDVQTVREIEAARYPTPEELIRIANLGPRIFGSYRQDVAIPNNSMHTRKAPYFPFGAVFAVTLFGSLHMIAWNYEYPTHIERTFWRGSVIITLIAFPLMLCCALLTMILKSNSLADKLQLYVIIPIFIAARLFILVEVVRSLAYQPPDVFRTTWAASVPHMG